MVRLAGRADTLVELMGRVVFASAEDTIGIDPDCKTEDEKVLVISAEEVTFALVEDADVTR